MRRPPLPRAARDESAAAAPRPHPLTAADWFGALKRALKRSLRDSLPHLAGSLTYYAVLAIFPALIVVVALLGIFGQYPRTTDALFASLSHVGPSSLVSTIRAPIEGVVRHKGGAGALLGFGLVLALWSAGGYIGAFIWATNQVYEVPEERPIWKRLPLQIGLAAAMIVVLTLVMTVVVVSGPVAHWLGDLVGLGHAAVVVWSIVKWPALFAIAALSFAVLYYVAPNVRHPRFRLFTTGATFGVAVWIAASVAFSLYVSRLGHYNATYGSLGAVIVFLLWLWIFNLALLFGVEFDAELELAREAAGGERLPRHGIPVREPPKGSAAEADRPAKEADRPAKEADRPAEEGDRPAA